MFHVRAFICERLTQQFIDTSWSVGVNSNLLKDQLIERIKVVKALNEDESDYDSIRRIFEELKDENYIKSHLAVLFMKPLTTISQVISDPNRGTGQVGRKRSLTRQQEDEIISYVQNCQRSGHCVTFAQVTNWVNEDLLDGDEKVSQKYVCKNNYIMNILKTAVPQPVEELRIEACYYQNFRDFFNRLEMEVRLYNYDPDLIINVDETTTNAEKSKRSTHVLYDPTINIRPIATYGSKTEHITMCSAITASGKSLTPTFIIKNKNVTVEDTVVGPLCDCGDYALASSPNGWQDGVSDNI